MKNTLSKPLILIFFLFLGGILLNPWSLFAQSTKAEVDLVFEALSYTPPFYQGKALHVAQGTVVVVAIPNFFDQAGRKINSADLNFTWRKDGLVVGNASGVGRDYLNFTGTIPTRDANIAVSVSSRDGSLTANSSVLIKNISPKIIFYENSLIYGLMLNKAITGPVRMLTDEFSVWTVPYYFSIGYADTPDLKYTWTLNGSTVPTQEIKNVFTVRQEQEGAGIANIGVKIENIARIFQYANNNFTINFEKR